MPAEILSAARKHIVDTLNGQQNKIESKHPWRMNWEFAVLHSLRVENYALKILSKDQLPLTESDLVSLRLAAILHDIARLDDRAHHAKNGALLARKWLENEAEPAISHDVTERVTWMIASHSSKDIAEDDPALAVLKDADTLDEIGIMSIFMASNWLEKNSPFFFHALNQRLQDVEIPFCDKKRNMLNTTGAKAILDEKKTYIESFMAQLSDELSMNQQVRQFLPNLPQDTTAMVY